MSKKRIVIISAVFYPRNSPRANRTTELAKAFARKGHDVTVYAVLGKYNYTQFEETHQLKVRNLGNMKIATLNSDGKSKTGLFRSILTKLFKKALEFPDIELSFKVANVLRKERDIDLLITVAVPFPIHWGAAYASRHFARNNINTWIADCGDPYMGNRFNKHPFYFKYVEKWFCKKADYLTIPIKEAKEAYYKEFHDKIRIIPQGFNFDEVRTTNKVTNNNVVTFIYAGGFYKGIRDPRLFLEFLCEIKIDFKFIVFTKSEYLIESYKDVLGNKLEVRDYIPRTKLLNVMSQADFLVNFENDTEVQSPSKLIDYALSKRPILSVNSFKIDKKQVNQFLNRDYTNQFVVYDIEQYNIKNVTNKFLQLIK